MLVLFSKGQIQVHFADEYQKALDNCAVWLAPSYGSEVPEGFQPIRLINYEPAFTKSDDAITLFKMGSAAHLTPIGEGSYARVYSFTDPNYGIRFALKRVRIGLNQQDFQRFRQEYDVLKRLSFPYLVEVYLYNEDRDEYIMEYCDETLRSFIARRNGDLPFSTRKRIALQFLYGINYLHSKGYLHRDLSLQNVLVKVYDSGAAWIKISDLGLVKDEGGSFTRTATEMKGTIRDPWLTAFKDYGTVNEVHAVGHILAYILTGNEALPTDNNEVARIINKCSSVAPPDRYQNVLAIIADVESLDVQPTGSSA